MPASLDLSRFPLVRLTYGERFGASFEREIRGYMRDTYARGRFAILVDMRPLQAKEFFSMFQTIVARAANESMSTAPGRLLAKAYVCESPLKRGSLINYELLLVRPSPSRIFREPAAGERWLVEQLALAGLKPGGGSSSD